MQKNMHILMLPSWYIPHGGQFVRNQAQALKEKGLTVNVLANVSLALTFDKTKYFTLPYRTFVSEEDDLTVFRFFQRSIPKTSKLNGLLWSYMTVRLFEKYQKKFGAPDIIHVHSALWGGYAAYLIKQKYNIPYIITEHRGVYGCLCEFAKKNFEEWQTPFLEKAFSNADYITPVSKLQIPKIKTFLTKEIPVLPVSNVINTDFFHFKERKNDTETIKFVATNGLYFVKAYDILIPAFDNACGVNPNIEISIVGENFEGKEFQKIWNGVKHKDCFRFTGELTAEGVRNELWNADIFIIPSRVESQSVATLEALSTGLPIIATTTIPKIMTTPENSIVVPVENTEAMTDAIIEMSKNYKNYNSKAISEHIKTVCSKEAFTKAIMSVYQQVFDNKK